MMVREYEIKRKRVGKGGEIKNPAVLTIANSL